MYDLCLEKRRSFVLKVFSPCDLCAHALNLSTGGHRICNFIRPFLGHHYYTLLGLVVEKKVFKEIMHFHYVTFMLTS